MKNNKLLLVLLLIIPQLTGGCAMEKKGNKFPYDTKEHIEEYILKELKQNYKINFSYLHEWEGMPYESEFSVYNTTPDNSEIPESLKRFTGRQIATYFTGLVEPADKKTGENNYYSKYGVSANSKEGITDCCHAYFFRDRITGNLLSIIGDSLSAETPYIRIIGLECPLGTWKGTESLKKYIKAGDFESYVYIYLPVNESDSEYAKQIKNILKILYTENAKQYNITLEVRQNDDKITFENRKGSVIFYQDLDQFDIQIDHWTEEMILEHINSDKDLNTVKPEDIYQ